MATIKRIAIARGKFSAYSVPGSLHATVHGPDLPKDGVSVIGKLSEATFQAIVRAAYKPKEVD